jgi:small GTP-binding protein
MPDNKAILLTPPGAAANAVIRLQGPKVREFLAKYFSAGAPQSMRCSHGTLRDEESQVIDDPVVVVSDDGNTADLNLHGGPWVVNATLELARRFGFDLVQKCRADVSATIEQEVLESLPLATTELALKVLLNQVDAWKRLEGETEPRPPNEIRKTLVDRALHWLLHPPRVAIVGAPNVGKSTLANQLFARERSITADLPGTTRDWVGEIANLEGLAVMLVDTPGLRETDDAIEQEAIARSRKQIERADLVLVVLDVTRPMDDPEQNQLRERFPDAINVLNKCDLDPKREIADGEVAYVSAKTGEGVGTLIDRIKTRFGCMSIDLGMPRCWTERQREWLRTLK